MIRQRSIASALAAVLLAALWGCIPHGVVPVVRIGLVAPFEGRYREVGYDVIQAVRLALYRAAIGGGIGGYMVELVAFDDGGDPASAVEQARKVTRDPTVSVVIGHWLESTTRSAQEVYADEGMPLITTASTVEGTSVFRLTPGEDELRTFAADCLPDAILHLDFDESVTEAARYVRSLSPGSEPVIGPPIWGIRQFRLLTADSASELCFVTGYAASYDLPGGVGPMADVIDEWSESPLAYAAYDTAMLALDAIARASESGHPTREAVTDALRGADLGGLTGHIVFDGGNRVSAPVYVYCRDVEGHLDLVCDRADYLRRRTER